MKTLINSLKYNNSLFTFTKRLKTFLLFDLKFPKESLAKIIAIQKIIPHSMMLPSSLHQLVAVIKSINKRLIEGDIVECGVYKGGSAALMAWASNYYKKTRKLYLYDSFQGFPNPSLEDKKGIGKKFSRGRNKAPITDVRRALKKLNVDSQNTYIFKGWFGKRLFNRKPIAKRIALLHIDCDLYESHLRCLEGLHDRVMPGGVIVFNDYGYLPGAAKAIRQFFKQKNIKCKFPPKTSKKPFLYQKK